MGTARAENPARKRLVFSEEVEAVPMESAVSCRSNGKPYSVEGWSLPYTNKKPSEFECLLLRILFGFYFGGYAFVQAFFLIYVGVPFIPKQVRSYRYHGRLSKKIWNRRIGIRTSLQLEFHTPGQGEAVHFLYR